MRKTQRISGYHVVRAILNSRPQDVVSVWLDRNRVDDRMGSLQTELARWGVPVRFTERGNLERLAGDNHHQGIVAEVIAPPVKTEKDLLQALEALRSPPLILVLDHVQDPHNLGACLRTADGAGAHGVVIPRDRSAGMTGVVCKAASGATETVPVYRVTNLRRTLCGLKSAGLWVVGAAGDASQELFETDLRGPVALVAGGEGKGLRRLTREACDLLVRIPLCGAVESLNVSVACAVLLYEALRQRVAGG